MYMQQRTGSFKEQFSKNTFYRFLNSTKTNWLRFISLLAADIVNNDIRDLINQEKKKTFEYVFLLDSEKIWYYNVNNIKSTKDKE